MSKKRKGITLTGGSSLLVIFAVLCLTVFALLTLSTVKADLRLADAAVHSVMEYYSADCAAEEILAIAGKAGETDYSLTLTDMPVAVRFPVIQYDVLTLEVVCVLRLPPYR